MNEIKTVVLHDKDLNSLARQIENYQNKSGLISKGSLPFFNTNTNEYLVIMFFPKPLDNKMTTSIETAIKSNDLVAKDRLEGSTKSQENTFKPTKQLLEKWKTQKPSPNTINLLKKFKYTNKELAEVKTQYDAYCIIESMKEKTDFNKNGSFK